jgi:uncharacterized membrane protein YgcG
MKALPNERCLIEELEFRTLFSTISVTSFGATPNDGSDDTFQIQEAINSSKSGDTIFFPAGNYNINGQLDKLPGNRTFTSNGDATLSGRTATGELLHINSDNDTITNLTFNGGGIFIDKTGGFNQGIIINNDVFDLNTSGPNNNAITFTVGLANSQISNNLFTGYTGGFGIYGYNYQGLTIANNEFVNVGAGAHIDAQNSSDGNLIVEQNYLTGIKGMGLEFQGSATNLTFQDNWYENPNLSSTASQNLNAFAYSLILDKSSNILIQRNVAIATTKPDGIGARVGFEVGGDNAMVRDNYVDGTQNVVEDNDGSGSSSVTVENNLFFGYATGPYIAFPSPIRTLTLINNGPNVHLDWDINRGRPQRNATFGGLPIDEAFGSDPITTPVVDPSLIPPTNLVAKDAGDNVVDLTWQDNATGELGYQIERSLDGGNTWVQFAVVSANVTSYAAVNLAGGTNVEFRIRAYSPVGESAYSNVATATPTGSSGSSSPTSGGSGSTSGGSGGASGGSGGDTPSGPGIVTIITPPVGNPSPIGTL